jgi:uncharacterized protein
MQRTRRALIGASTVLVLAVGWLVLAGPASAHVTVSAPGATSGGSDQIITFRVPNESATAATTELQVKFPTDTPIASVLPQPHPGWTVTTTTVKLAKPIVTDDGDITDAVSTITWKADSKADGIPVGQFDQFPVIAGQLPDTASLTFPAIQTYSDGSVVNWVEVAAPGSTEEPDHPAPVLTLAAAAKANATSPAPAVATAKGSSNTGAVVLAVIALVLAAGSIGYTTIRVARRS